MPQSVTFSESDFEPTAAPLPQSFDTPLTAHEESQFKIWKARYAPRDSGADYDLRGAFKAGLRPDPQSGHWPDTFKKPNHPTFSNESKYAVGENAAKAGLWDGERFIPPNTSQPLTFSESDFESPASKPPTQIASPPKLEVSPSHQAQSQRDFSRRSETAQFTHTGERPPEPDTSAVRPSLEDLQEPLTHKAFGFTVSDIADALFPEARPLQADTATAVAESGGSSTLYDMARRTAKTAAGIVDWMQSPEAVAAAAIEAVSAGSATPVIGTLLGMQFGAQGTKQAIGGLEKIRKGGVTPENTEEFLQGLAIATGGMLGPAGIRDSAVKRTAAIQKVRELAQTKEWIERTKYYAERGAIEKEAARIEAAKRPNQAERRATLEVPETTAPEDATLRFTDAELEELTRPEPKVETFSEGDLETPQDGHGSVLDTKAAETVAPTAENVPTPRPEPSATTPNLDFETQQPEVETKPPISEPEALKVEAETPKREPTLQSFREDLDVLRKHETRGGAADVSGGKEYANYGERLAKAAEKAPDAAVADYLDKLRETAEVHFPDTIETVDRAQDALASGDRAAFAAEAEKARAEMREEYGRRLATSEAEKHGLKLSEESKPRVRKPKTEEAPKTAHERLIHDSAESEMQTWAETVRETQDQQKRSESAMTMESNVAGKEIEEGRDKKAASIRSLGAKEGSPLEKFTETPEDLASAIEDRGGRLKDSKKAKLYQRIQKAFRETYHDTHGSAIEEYLSKATDEQKRDLFGDEAGTLNFEEGSTESGLGRTEGEGMQKLVGGRKTEQLKEGKIFDDTRLVESELFQGKGGKQKNLGEDDVSFDFGENVVKTLDDFETRQKEQLKQLWKGAASGETLGAQLPLEIGARLIAIGATKVAKGIVKFGQWSAEMIRDFGEEVRPHLYAIYHQALDRVAELRKLEADDYFNFKRANLSDAEKEALRGEVIGVVLETGRLPKERESWDTIRKEAARVGGPEMVAELDNGRAANSPSFARFDMLPVSASTRSTERSRRLERKRRLSAATKLLPLKN
jgi:hypothetical protein